MSEGSTDKKTNKISADVTSPPIDDQPNTTKLEDLPKTNEEIIGHRKKGITKPKQD